MSQSSKFEIRGLYTNINTISGVPEGSLSIAKNIDLSQTNLAKYRRGFDKLALSDTSYKSTKLFDYSSAIFSIHNSAINYYNGSVWASSGSIIAPTNALGVRSAVLQQNLYLTSNAGIKKLDVASGTIYQAGIPKGLMMELTADTSKTGTAVAASSATAYTYVITRRDANNNLILGGVSSREIYSTSYPSVTFNGATAVNTGTDVITLGSGHGFSNTNAVTFTTSGTLPTGLTAGTTYYIISATSTTVQVSLTSGGSAVDITAVGVGNSTITYTPVARNVAVKGFIPTTIDSSYIIQVYRTADTPNTATPNTEAQLCYEMPITSQMFSTYTKTFTSATDVNTGTDTITSTAHGFVDGTIIKLTTSGTLPTGLTAGVDYYIVSSTTNTLQLATSYGGTAVDITAIGSGTHTISGVNAFSFYDLTPSALLGTTIYTANSQQGPTNDNAEPPIASDICEYKQYLFYADVVSKHRYTGSLISVYDGASSGELRNGDTITISNGTNTEIYTASSTAANISTKTFYVNPSGSTPSIRIDSTIRSFISVVNQASSYWYAYLTATSSSSLPGGFRLESRTLGTAAFTVVSSRAASFSPQLVSPATSTNTSTSDAFRNGLMFSKQGQPEAVPIKNQFKVGSSDDPIKRIIALRDSLLIFKERDGIYRLSGENEFNFSVTVLDETAKIIAVESLQVLNGSCYGLFQAGIGEISDVNVEYVSEPIKDKLLTLYGTCLAQVKAYAFAVGYQTEGKYILALPETSAATSSTYQLIYDVFSGSFWEWDLNIASGYVNSVDGKLYLSSGLNVNSGFILKEKKAFDFTDFCDYEQTCTLTAASGTTLTLSGTSSMSVGDLIEQGSLLPAYITSINVSAGTIEVDVDQTWALSTVTHNKAINATIRWNPDYAGAPAGSKHYQQATFLFDTAIIQTATISFFSDVNPTINNIDVTGPSSTGGWGYGAWGEGVWGGQSSPLPIRIGVPRTSARCNSLTITFNHHVAKSDWRLSGMSLDFNPISNRTAR